MVVRDLPFDERKLGDNEYERVFTDASDEELVWHRDREDREVQVIESDGWMLQMENQLPVAMAPGSRFYIPKEVYHRVIRGNGPMRIVLKKLV